MAAARLDVGASSLPRRLPRIALFLLEERVLDFIMDTEQPCLCARGAISKMGGFGLELSSPFFRGAQLKR